MAELFYLPETGDDLDELDLAESRMPSFTFKVNEETQRVKGMTDLADALSQAIYHILSIERYQYVIYPQSYGSEIGELIGRPKDYAASELKRTISEALLQDDRIEALDNWSFEFGKKKVTATFTVTSIFGEFELRGDLTR